MHLAPALHFKLWNLRNKPRVLSLFFSIRKNSLPLSLFINKNIVCKLHFSYGYLFSIFLTFISYSAKINKFSAKYYYNVKVTYFCFIICFSFNLTKIYLPTKLYNVTTFSIKSIKKLLFWVFSALLLIVSWAYICHKHTLSKKKKFIY